MFTIIILITTGNWDCPRKAGGSPIHWNGTSVRGATSVLQLVFSSILSVLLKVYPVVRWFLVFWNSPENTLVPSVKPLVDSGRQDSYSVLVSASCPLALLATNHSACSSNKCHALGILEVTFSFPVGFRWYRQGTESGKNSGMPPFAPWQNAALWPNFLSLHSTLDT